MSDFANNHSVTYIWIVLELAYLCRMRGIEVLDLADANETQEGLEIQRRKGSNNNIVLWTPRLRSVWEAAKARRDSILSKRKQPVPINPKHRYLFVAERGGNRLSKSGFDSAWNRFINAALEQGVISPEERFSPHALKRKGVTDTPGTKADKKAASGHKSDSVLDVYDDELQRVAPAGKDESKRDSV